ncbi:MAG: DUF5675 family protein [Prevotella sp.]
MLLILKRYYESEEMTLGNLYVGGTVNLLCQTLEPGIPLKKDPYGCKGHKRIMAGKYRVVNYKSPRFKRWLPLLLNVPHRSAIEIHAGNEPQDTRGCILVGTTDGPLTLNNSQSTLKRIVSLVTDALSEDKEVTIWIQEIGRIAK